MQSQSGAWHTGLESLICCATWASPFASGNLGYEPVKVQMVPGSSILLPGGWKDEIMPD